MFKSKKGQIALEVLVIFGVLVIGSIIFGLFYMNNVKDILVEGPGTKQDKNGGGDVYDDLEGSLIYNEEQQIGSSSHGITGGSGGSSGTGGTDDPEDPPVPYCGDGECNGTETTISCPQDCTAGYFFGSLELSILPEDIAYTTDKITINVTFESDAQSSQISQINIKKYNLDDYAYYDTIDCGLMDYDNNYTYLNVGELLPLQPGYLTGSFDFICNQSGYYEFTFSINTGEDTITNYINKEIVEPEQPLEFISVWDTDYTGSGLTKNNEILLPLINSGNYDFYVDWGDGEITHITNNDSKTVLYAFSGVDYDGVAKHEYIRPGEYIVTITGTIEGFTFVRPDFMGGVPVDAIKLKEISQWGPLRLGSQGQYFKSAQNLVITATDLLDTSDVTDMSYMFSECTLTDVPRISEWDTSNVTDMSRMFYYSPNFNQPLSFDTSNVRDMSHMFYYATKFNSVIDFDTSNVVNMQSMFEGARKFNQPLSFNTSNVTDMSYMFYAAEDFNSSINFNTSSVTNMANMFNFARNFNQPLNFDTSNVTNMDGMFYFAENFDQNISNWNVNYVLSWVYMFEGCPIRNEYKPQFR
ncbi:MAG TPA: BspA family leucine-rich repeat surface protein [archaeon]|nr:BspA family leucine-rich repeat surface protein [archaeon]